MSDDPYGPAPVVPEPEPEPGSEPSGERGQASGRRREPPGSREMTIVLSACIAGAGACLLSGSQVWLRARVVQAAVGPSGSGVVPFDFALVGRTVSPAVTAWGLLALAAVLAVTATRRVGRIATGVLITLAGLAEVTAVLVVRSTPRKHALQAGPVEKSLGVFDPVAVAVAQTGWPWLAFAGGVVLVVAGLLVVVRGGRWGAMSSKYERPAQRQAPPPGPAGTWDAIDRGDDVP